MDIFLGLEIRTLLPSLQQIISNIRSRKLAALTQHFLYFYWWIFARVFLTIYGANLSYKQFDTQRDWLAEALFYILIHRYRKWGMFGKLLIRNLIRLESYVAKQTEIPVHCFRCQHAMGLLGPEPYFLINLIEIHSLEANPATPSSLKIVLFKTRR